MIFYKENRHKFLLKVADESWTESMQFHKISYFTLFSPSFKLLSAFFYLRFETFVKETIATCSILCRLFSLFENHQTTKSEKLAVSSANNKILIKKHLVQRQYH